MNEYFPAAIVMAVDQPGYSGSAGQKLRGYLYRESLDQLLIQIVLISMSNLS